MISLLNSACTSDFNISNNISLENLLNGETIFLIELTVAANVLIVGSITKFHTTRTHSLKEFSL